MDNGNLFQIESLRSRALRAHARKSMVRLQPPRRTRAREALHRLWLGLRRLVQ
jgi:hypothetical protein